MPIKKRNSVPDPNAVFDDGPQKLVIVAKPKKPIPDKGLTNMYDNPMPPVAARALGNLVQSMGDSPDEALTIKDRVELMRTPYDPHNSQEARYRGRVRNRGTAITAMCIVCSGGRKAVTECADTTCPLWAFRFGGDPFYGKRK